MGLADVDELELVAEAKPVGRHEDGNKASGSVAHASGIQADTLLGR